MRNFVYSGESGKSLFLPNAGMGAMAMEGIYANLCNFPQFDFDQPWWGKNDAQRASVGTEKAYLGVSYITWLRASYMYALVINKSMAEKYQLTIPYQDVFDGT